MSFDMSSVQPRGGYFCVVGVIYHVSTGIVFEHVYPYLRILYCLSERAHAPPDWSWWPSGLPNLGNLSHLSYNYCFLVLLSIINFEFSIGCKKGPFRRQVCNCAHHNCPIRWIGPTFHRTINSWSHLLGTETNEALGSVGLIYILEYRA